jgi:hypothetical protein
MRPLRCCPGRIAPLAFVLLLTGCQGFGTFLGDTESWPGSLPTQPLGDSENMHRVRAEPVVLPPLTTEPGNVWPAQEANVPTLQDVERQQNINPSSPPPQTTPDLPAHRQPRPGERGSSTPPGSNQPPLPPLPNLPSVPQVQAPTNPGPSPGQVVPVPGGPPSVVTGGNGRYRTTTPPGGVGGGQGVLIPNGNGTSTLIGPDGSVTTVPTPK